MQLFELLIFLLFWSTSPRRAEQVFSCNKLVRFMVTYLAVQFTSHGCFNVLHKKGPRKLRGVSSWAIPWLLHCGWRHVDSDSTKNVFQPFRWKNDEPWLGANLRLTIRLLFTSWGISWDQQRNDSLGNGMGQLGKLETNSFWDFLKQKEVKDHISSGPTQP